MHIISPFIQKPYTHDMSHTHAESCPPSITIDIEPSGATSSKHTLVADLLRNTRCGLVQPIDLARSADA